MALLKVEDFYSNYSQDSDRDNLKHFDVYAQQDNKVGSVYDILVDSESGRMRYFVVDTGFWVFGKKVLLPVGQSHIDQDDRRIYANNMTKEQVENLPDYDELEKVDYDYEEQVRGVYRPTKMTGTASTKAQTKAQKTKAQTKKPTYDRDSYSYDYDSDLYDYNDRNQDSLKLYKERLIANKSRQKTGEVTIGNAPFQLLLIRQRAITAKSTTCEEIVPMSHRITHPKIDRQICDHHPLNRTSWKLSGIATAGLLAFVFSACQPQQREVVAPISPSQNATVPTTPSSTISASPASPASPGSATSASPAPLTKPLAELIGQTVTVSTKVQRVITPNLFTVYDVESLRGQTVLVVSKNPAPPANTNIELTGVVRNFVVVDVKNESGIDITPDIERVYVNKPYVAAAAIEKVD